VKWSGFGDNAGDRVYGLLKRVLPGRVLGALLMLGALGIVLGANAKWSP
jgi:hypothetical protein